MTKRDPAEIVKDLSITSKMVDYASNMSPEQEHELFVSVIKLAKEMHERSTDVVAYLLTEALREAGLQTGTIETEDEYKAALERLDVIFDADLGSAEGAELNALVDAIMAYEAIHHPIAPATPEAIEALLKDNN